MARETTLSSKRICTNRARKSSTLPLSTASMWSEQLQDINLEQQKATVKSAASRRVSFR